MIHWSESEEVQIPWASALQGAALGAVFSALAAFGLTARIQSLVNGPTQSVQSSVRWQPLLRAKLRADLGNALASRLQLAAPEQIKLLAPEMTGERFAGSDPREPKGARQVPKIGTHRPEQKRRSRAAVGRSLQMTGQSFDNLEVRQADLQEWAQRRSRFLEVQLESKVQAEVAQWFESSQLFGARTQGLQIAAQPPQAHGFVTSGATFGSFNWFVGNHTESGSLRPQDERDTLVSSVSAPARVAVRAEQKRIQPTHRVAGAEHKTKRPSVSAVQAPSELPVFAARVVPVSDVSVAQGPGKTLRAAVEQLNSQNHQTILDSQQVSEAKSSVWSFEGWSHRSTEGWIVTTAADHWPTLSYLRADAPSSSRLTSYRDASIMAALAGVTIQPTAGLLVGSIPAGYSVELSGRSEYPIYWKQDKGQVSSQDIEEERSFAFLNVEPGMQVVSLVHAWTGERIPVAVAIVGGYSTDADLRAIRKVSVRGKVSSASARTFAPVSGVTVSRVGQLDSVVKTDSVGSFRFGELLVAGNLPLYFEYHRAAGSFPHRVRVQTSDHNAIEVGTLFGFDDQQIVGWVSQLEGGVSPESGVIVGAWGANEKQLRANSLYPVTYPIEPNPVLEPETYYLEGGERLTVAGTLSPGRNRIMSTQLVAGLHKVELRDEVSDEVSWSEIGVASPGVVTQVRTGL